MALKVEGLWDVTGDGQKVKKYKWGADPVFPSLVTVSAASMAPTVGFPSYWLDGGTHSLVLNLVERWRDNGDLWDYSGGSFQGNLVAGNYAFVCNFPTIDGVKFTREIEVQTSGGVKFTPPAPSLPNAITLGLPFGPLESLSLRLTTNSVDRVRISSINEYVTRYRRVLTVESYSCSNVEIELARNTVKGDGKTQVGDPAKINDSCSTSYSDGQSSLYTAPATDWLGCYSPANYAIQHINDGVYSFNDLVAPLGFEKRYAARGAGQFVYDSFAFYWKFDRSVFYSS